MLAIYMPSNPNIIDLPCLENLEVAKKKGHRQVKKKKKKILLHKMGNSVKSERKEK